MLKPQKLTIATGALLPLIFVWIVGATVLSSCGATDPEGADCRGSALYRKCTITEGEYLGFSIGMGIEPAFDQACSMISSDRFLGRPMVYSAAEGVNYDSRPFCATRAIALSADYWSFVEPGSPRERRVTLHFEDSELVAIDSNLRGWDP